MNRSDLNRSICNLFGDELIHDLKRFAARIDQEKADIVILLARKALCLFELFNYIGISLPHGEIVSDRVLDLEMDYLRGKKVVVVDDTLILGTTLNGIKKRLEENNIDYKVFAFCVDENNWLKTLIEPDYVEQRYSSGKLLQFCTTAVNAFEAVSLPYLVDFPCTNFVDVEKVYLENALSDPRVTTVPMMEHGAYGNSKYVFLLGENLKENFKNVIGNRFWELIYSVKVRLYVNDSDEIRRVRLVPIVLFKSIHGADINLIFDHLVGQIKDATKRELIFSLMVQEDIKLRLIQYYLSLLLGYILIDNIFSDKAAEFEFRNSYSINLFGKKLSAVLDELFKCRTIMPYTKAMNNSDLLNIQGLDHFDTILSKIHLTEFSVLHAFKSIFTTFVDEIELPARKRLRGGEISEEAQNRLKKAIPLDLVVRNFCNRLSIDCNDRVIEVMGICLDFCNDLGIAVPVICCANSYYYRGYRHGELGKRSILNTYYLYRFLEAFSDKNNYKSGNGFDKLLLEKLTVLFYRVGAKKRWIDITEDYSSSDAVNIGFYLMGAIAITNGKEYFPNKQQDWFLQRNCYNLFKVGADKKYHYNVVPREDGLAINKEKKATLEFFGDVLGRLIYTPRSFVDNAEGKMPPLTPEKLTILATCYSAGDICMALAAEMQIINNWLHQFDQEKYIQVGKAPFDDAFQTSTVYMAFNQALFKYKNSFCEENVVDILAKCREYLQENKAESYVLSMWDGIEKDMGIGKNTLFDPNERVDVQRKEILECAKQILEIVFKLGVWLIYIRFLIERRKMLKDKRIVENSIFSFVDQRTHKRYTRVLVSGDITGQDNDKMNLSQTTLAGRTFRGKKVGNKVRLLINGKTYQYSIVNVDNRNIVYQSDAALRKFAQNVEIAMSACVYEPLKDINFDDYHEVQGWIDDFKEDVSEDQLHEEVRRVLREMKGLRVPMEALLEQATKLYGKTKVNFSSNLP